MSNITEADVADMLRGGICKKHQFRINNIYLYKWESDFLSITRAGMVWEFEIKLSKADFKNDFKKKGRHKALTKESKAFKPNRFYFVYPRRMVDPKEIPDHYGIIEFEVGEDGRPYWPKVVRKAKMLTSKKFDRWKYLAIKFYYQNIKLIKELKSRK